MDFLAHWINSGTTPGSGTSHISYDWNIEALDNRKNFEFPDRWSKNAPHQNIPFVLGPKGDVAVETGEVPGAVIEGVFARPQQIYLTIYGWAKYRDIFPNSKEHLTEFCAQMSPIEKTLNKDGTFALHFRMINCSKFNCYDAHCKDYKTRIRQQ